MGCLHAIWSVITGFLIGLLARAILPGSNRMGFIMTVILGIAGSLVGGFLSSLVSKPPEGSRFHAAGFLWSVVGAIVLLLLWRFVR